MNFFIIFILSITITASAYGQIGLDKSYDLEPVLISSENGNSIGTGILYMDSLDIYMITAKHVLQDVIRYGINSKKLILNEGILSITCFPIRNTESFNYKKDTIKIDMKYLAKIGYIKFHPYKDIAIIKIAKILPDVRDKAHYYGNSRKGLDLNTIKIENVFTLNNVTYFKDVMVSREIFVFGYSRTIGLEKNYQYDFDIPLIHKGVISAKNYKKFIYLIDCSVYDGNSGGPVITIEQKGNITLAKIIGIITEYIPYRQNSILFNSGYSIVVPIEYALDLIKTF